MKFSRIFHFVVAEGQVSARSAAHVCDAEQPHVLLFDKLRSVFLTHPRRQFGFFESAEESVMALALRAHHATGTGHDALAEQLAGVFQSALPSDGDSQSHLWLVMDESGDSEVFYLFLLQHDESFFVSADLQVESGPSLYTNRLQYAARIHLNEWLQDGAQNYLSMIAPRNNAIPKTAPQKNGPLTPAWHSLIGFSEGMDRSANTETFLDTIEQYTQTLAPEQAQEYRTKVVDFCIEQDKQGLPIGLQALSAHVDEAAPAALLDFVSEHVESPPQEFYADRRQLRRYTRLFGRDQDLSIGFSTALLGRHISYDEHTETLTIRALPKALKSQLRQFFTKAE